MALNIAKEVAAMERMTAKGLQQKHLEVFGEPSRSSNKAYLVKRIAWRMQANEYGDLSALARRRAQELANDADLRSTPPKTKHPSQEGSTVRLAASFDHDRRLPMPGGIVTREYKGRQIMVKVLPKGFEFEGQMYRSLSAVAKAVTGTHWNGYHFFEL